ncbi:MAG: ABC transporter permease subunit [Candidatus Omnitrophica bacterium]|nr:MAG: ABC-2 family transporter protein [Candidatus Hinthialibacteria bacterium OLB16]MBE7489462.1 ABC transporter permease subunit [bacterium]MCC6734276.1 ABC transporter permease subunit [Candidatus Omnitrophota bacterium]MCE7906808.1 hypothetical protein [Candidatus Omnitrophica bacterium COP1]MBV6483297.1 hypothetical protein [bacterium]
MQILRIEIYKMIHQRKLALGVAGLALFSLFLQVGFRYQGRNPLTAIARRGDFDMELVLNSINSTRLIVNSCYYLFLPILTAMIFAGQIAGERSQGTLFGILSRPVSRWSLFLGKFLVSTLALLAVVLFFVGFTFLVGCVLFGAHDFLSSPRIFDLLDEYKSTILSFETGIYRLFITSLVLTFLLLPTGAIAFYCSLLFHQTHTAMATSLLIFYGSYVLQGLGNIEWLSLFSRIQPYLFTTAMESWMYVFYPAIEWGEIIPRAVLVLIYTLAIMGTGLVQFHYQDLTE